MPPPKFTILYHAGFPGRAEPIRLLFEATKTPYTDTAKTASVQDVYALLDPTSPALGANPPVLAPPLLKVSGAGKNGSDLILSQTANILAYLGAELGLAGTDRGVDEFHVAQIAQTALDLQNEVHDTHHPIASGLYYEDQKPEALRKSKDVRENRIPKFLRHFEGVLRANEREGGGRFLVSGRLSYADLVVWQVVDGLKFAFPKEMQARARQNEFPTVREKFFPAIEELIKEYLASDRRAKYTEGVYRHYPELDRQ